MQRMKGANKIGALVEAVREATLTTDDVAKALGVTRMTITLALREGRLKGYRVGKSWKIAEQDLESWLRRLQPNR